MNELDNKYRHIIKEWNKVFPFLKPYTPSTLMLRTEILLIGLRFSRYYSEEYRIYLEIYPLWKAVKSHPFFPIFYNELRNREGRQFFINIKRHQNHFEEAVECAKIQFGGMLQKDIFLTDMANQINSYLNRYDNHNPLDWTRMFELELSVSTILSDNDLRKNLIHDINDQSQYWNPEHFLEVIGMSINNWETKLYATVGDQDFIKAEVMPSLHIQKIARLNEAVLINNLKNNKWHPDTGVIKFLLKRLKALKSNWK